MRLAVLVGGLSSGPIWACSSFSGSSDSPDASSDAAPTAPTSLLKNGGFEEAPAITCAPGWNPYAGTSVNTPTHRTGSYGCLVCANGPNDYGRIFSTEFVNPEAGTYVLTTFNRQAPDAGPDFSAVVDYLDLYAKFPDGGEVVQGYSGVPSNAEFVPRSVTLTIPSGVTSLQASLMILSNQNGGGCAVFDDTTLTFTSP